MPAARRKFTQNKPVNQRKEGSSGRKSMRGVPELYDEVKIGVKVSLTPKCVKILDHLAQLGGHSRSEFIERVARTIAHASDDPAIKEILRSNQPKHS